MSKYEQQLADLKTQLTSASNIAVLLPTQINTDKLAAGLALMLALKNAGKNVTVATDALPMVSQANLYGVGEVKNSLSLGGSNDLTLVLENVVAADGTVPSLEKLDWYPEGNNLNLVFHVIPGQSFKPTNIQTKPQGGLIDLVFSLGAVSLNDLGNIYSQNVTQLSALNLVNIDNNPVNGNFGKMNLVDPTASAVSQIVALMITDLGLNLDSDIASNLIGGIYGATSNMTQNINPELFAVVGNLMQFGGILPQAMQGTAQSQVSSFGINSPVSPPMPVNTVQPQEATQPEPVVQPEVIQPQNSNAEMTSNPFLQSPQTSDILSIPPQSAPMASTSNLPPFMQPVISPVANAPLPVIEPSTPEEQAAMQSMEERPTGEFAVSHNPETGGSPAPDWLTPKIFKGSAG